MEGREEEGEEWGKGRTGRDERGEEQENGGWGERGERGRIREEKAGAKEKRG